jgi:hypothetical protein
MTAGSAGWFEEEPPLGTVGRATAMRLARRSRASWPLWVTSAVLLSGALTFVRSRRPPSYEVTMVLRVVEGEMVAETRAMTFGDLNAQVEDLAFTNDRLISLMRRHVASFPEVVVDPTAALADLRERMKVTFAENDFIEERQRTDPRRSARIALEFRAADPDLAWTVTHELSELLADSGLERQRQEARREQQAASEAAKGAALDLTLAQRSSTGPGDRRVEGARDRLVQAQEREAAANLGGRVLAERLALRFDVVEPGRVPARINLKEALVISFVSTLLWTLMAGWMLAGAFDPRILDVEDLAALGTPVLGRVPPLGASGDAGPAPGPHAAGERGPRPRRVY